MAHRVCAACGNCGSERAEDALRQGSRSRGCEAPAFDRPGHQQFDTDANEQDRRDDPGHLVGVAACLRSAPGPALLHADDRGTVRRGLERRPEIFTPPYLFQGTHPSGRDTTATVSTPAPAAITAARVDPARSRSRPAPTRSSARWTSPCPRRSRRSRPATPGVRSRACRTAAATVPLEWRGRSNPPSNRSAAPRRGRCSIPRSLNE